MLDIRWLQDLIVVADVRNFTRASEIRNVTQSGLSRRIQSLETWVGASVIDRSRTPLDLTEAGYKLLDVAQGVVAQLNGVRRNVREDQHEALRSISFAAPHILSATLFPRWLQQVQGLLGPTRVSILSDNLPACSAALEDGRADFVICFVEFGTGAVITDGRRLALETCSSISIGRERLVPLSAPGEDGRPLHDLDAAAAASVSYLAYNRGCSLGWAVDRKLAGQPVLPHLNNLYDNSLADGLRSMALAGLGVAWLPLSTTHNDLARSRLVRSGPEDLVIDLDIRIHRSGTAMGRKAEELWTKLKAGHGIGTPVPETVLVTDHSSLSAGGAA